MANQNVAHGLALRNTDNSDISCTGCTMGKGHRTPIPKNSSSISTQLLELIHSDVCGPLEVQSLGGSRYFVTFIDDYSKWTVVYTMRHKSDTFSCFKKFHTYAETHTGRKVEKLNVIQRSKKNAEQIKALRTDNGGEYISSEFKKYLEEHGNMHQLTVAYTPQQNGVAERMNRTLMDLVRSMMHTAETPKKFWAEALATAVYVRNRVISRSLPKATTPYHLWMKKKPDLSHTRVFGSRCWYVIPRRALKKLDSRSCEGVFMGYSAQSKGCKFGTLNIRKWSFYET